MLKLFLIIFLGIIQICKCSELNRLFKRTANPVWTKKTNYDEEYAKRMLNLAAGAYAVSADACIQK